MNRRRPAAPKQKKRAPQVHIIGEPAILRPSSHTERRLEDFQAGMKAEAKRRGKPGPKRIFDKVLASELQDALEAHLKGEAKPKKQLRLVPWVAEQARARGRRLPQDKGDKIVREIVRPVYQRLGWAKTRS
jgi:hypothetical protein